MLSRWFMTKEELRINSSKVYCKSLKNKTSLHITNGINSSKVYCKSAIQLACNISYPGINSSKVYCK